ncbi:MAG: hypothetical protein HY721_33290 [Planctomycetes bacterium]|nr:hypothetical protein [Planctomycetota bacterium]
MSTAADLKQLETQVIELENAIRESARATKRAASVSVVSAVALVAIILAFLAINFSRVRAEMTEEKLTRSLTRELGELSPLLLNELTRLGQDLLPIYGDEVKTQLEKAWPGLEAKLQSELNELGSSATEHLETALRDSEQRVLQAAENAVMECYPETGDPEKRKDIEERLHMVCEQTLGRTLHGFETLFSKDVHRLQDTVFRFDLTDSGESVGDLQKKFIRLWLQLLDQEVMEL